jgi:hypothetical protein
MSLPNFGQPGDGCVQSAYRAHHADSEIRKRASVSRCGKILVAVIASAAIGWGQPVVSAVLNGASYSGNIVGDRTFHLQHHLWRFHADTGSRPGHSQCHVRFVC